MPNFDPDAFLQKAQPQLAPKPFDPDAFLAKASPAAKPQDSYLEQTGKGIGAAALGVADVVNSAVNPVNIGHDLETVGRAAYEYPTEAAKIYKENPNISFWGAAKQSLSDASKKTLIPEISVDQITAGARAGIDIAHRASIDGEIPSKETIKNIYQSEVKANEDFNKEIGPKIGRATGEGLAGAAMIGLLAKDIASYGASLSEKLGLFAEKQGYKAVSPMNNLNKAVTASGRDVEIGRQLLDDKIIQKPGLASYDTLLDRTRAKLSDYGEQIGHFAETADKARANDSAVRGLDIPSFVQEVDRRVVQPNLASASTERAGLEVKKWLQDFVRINQDPELASVRESQQVESNTMGFVKAQQEKTLLGQMKADFSANKNNVSYQAFNDVYHVLNDNIEKGISSALQKAGSKEEIGQFLEAKKSYRNLLDAESFLENAVSKGNSNLSIGLRELGSGMIGATIGGPAGAKVAISTASMAASKLSKTRGNQAAASFADAIKSILDSKRLETRKIPFVKVK